MDKTEARNKPLVKQIDEAGLTVYSVPKSFGKYFQEMFKDVDANMTSLNIAQYSIRSASLEEVFIDIGQREKLGKLKIDSSENRVTRTTSPENMKD